MFENHFNKYSRRLSRQLIHSRALSFFLSVSPMRTLAFSFTYEQSLLSRLVWHRWVSTAGEYSRCRVQQSQFTPGVRACQTRAASHQTVLKTSLMCDDWWTNKLCVLLDTRERHDGWETIASTGVCVCERVCFSKRRRKETTTTMTMTMTMWNVQTYCHHWLWLLALWWQVKWPKTSWTHQTVRSTLQGLTTWWGAVARWTQRHTNMGDVTSCDVLAHRPSHTPRYPAFSGWHHHEDLTCHVVWSWHHHTVRPRKRSVVTRSHHPGVIQVSSRCHHRKITESPDDVFDRKVHRSELGSTLDLGLSLSLLTSRQRHWLSIQSQVRCWWCVWCWWSHRV